MLTIRNQVIKNLTHLTAKKLPKSTYFIGQQNRPDYNSLKLELDAKCESI
jgi:hypothetical protein